MMYKFQNHWLSGLYPSFGILNTKKKNIVSESESSCLPLTRNIVFSSVQNSRRWPTPRKPVTPSVILHGQNPSEPEKKPRSLEN
jgi:hypothetical protein